MGGIRLIIEILLRAFRSFIGARVNISCLPPSIRFMVVASMATENPVSPYVGQLRKTAEGPEVVDRWGASAGFGIGIAQPLTVPAGVVTLVAQRRPEFSPVVIGGAVANPILEVIYPALSKLPGILGNFGGFRSPINPPQRDYSPSWDKSDCLESRNLCIKSA